MKKEDVQKTMAKNKSGSIFYTEDKVKKKLVFGGGDNIIFHKDDVEVGKHLNVEYILYKEITAIKEEQ